MSACSPTAGGSSDAGIPERFTSDGTDPFAKLRPAINSRGFKWPALRRFCPAESRPHAIATPPWPTRAESLRLSLENRGEGHARSQYRGECRQQRDVVSPVTVTTPEYTGTKIESPSASTKLST